MTQMEDQKTIKGFSKLSKLGKIKWIVEHFFTEPEVVMKELKSYWLSNEDQQRVLDGFSENTISNYPLPYGVAPNFVINGRTYAVPMVTEESSVVAAAASAAKYWMTRGGFKVEVLNTIKCGQIHFYWTSEQEVLHRMMPELEQKLIQDTNYITEKMRSRGGGILSLELKEFQEEPNYYQLFIRVETCDSMGANFINSILEQFAQTLSKELNEVQPGACDVIMSILSNYTPECLVRASVSCPIDDFSSKLDGYKKHQLADRFYKAVKIARIDPYRATTHNKGIFNGIDAVVLATGNDFRAIEACGHAYAARDGQYRSLSYCTIDDGEFRFWMDIPLAVGTVGGLTNLHPVARRSLELLGHPSARELMVIIAATGLAQNFAAVRSLVTTGIQAGHMKLHLGNILAQLTENEDERSAAERHFNDKVVSFAAVRDFIAQKRASLDKIS